MNWRGIVFLLLR